MMEYPSFNSIAKTEFAFLGSEFGCRCTINKEPWLLSVIFENDSFKIFIELGDKDLHFNVLLSIANKLTQVPLWAICKIEKYDAGIITGSNVENNSVNTMCENSSKALVALLPNIVQYGRTERRKIEKVLQKQSQARLNKALKQDK